MDESSHDRTSQQPATARPARGRPFRPGNPGRPKGARNKASRVAEVLLDGEAQALTRKAVDMALAGDIAALRLCLDRITPPRRDRCVRFALPKLETPADVAAGTAALIAAVAAEDLTPSEAAELGKLLQAFAQAFDLEERRKARDEEDEPLIVTLREF